MGKSTYAMGAVASVRVRVLGGGDQFFAVLVRMYLLNGPFIHLIRWKNVYIRGSGRVITTQIAVSFLFVHILFVTK